MTIRLTATAEVQPISLLKITTPIGGVVAGLDIVPGDTVPAGAILAHLRGPTVEGLFITRQSAVTNGEASLAAARQLLSIQQYKLARHLGTREMVEQAMAAVASARARLAAAKSALAALQGETTIRCPEAGQILAVQASNGEFAPAGRTLVTVQPAGRLWLTASFYGAGAVPIRPGMQGRFEPYEGSSAIPVTVRSIISQAQPGGGLRVELAATASPGWHSGEFGSVVLSGGTETLVAVPTRALILDQGRWWVMVRTSHGDRRQAVTPGPAQGNLTLIRRGLDPGAEVVVANAYLDFHRNIANSFQQPD